MINFLQLKRTSYLFCLKIITWTIMHLIQRDYKVFQVTGLFLFVLLRYLTALH